MRAILRPHRTHDARRLSTDIRDGFFLVHLQDKRYAAWGPEDPITPSYADMVSVRRVHRSIASDRL